VPSRHRDRRSRSRSPPPRFRLGNRVTSDLRRRSRSPPRFRLGNKRSTSR
jgi:hypothetical protein